MFGEVWKWYFITFSSFIAELFYKKIAIVFRRIGEKMKLLNYIALTVAIVGAVNWGLIGVLNFDLVAFIFGEMSWLSRIVYTLVGLSGIYLITFFGQLESAEE